MINKVPVVALFACLALACAQRGPTESLAQDDGAIDFPFLKIALGMDQAKVLSIRHELLPGTLIGRAVSGRQGLDNKEEKLAAHSLSAENVSFGPGITFDEEYFFGERSEGLRHATITLHFASRSDGVKYFNDLVASEAKKYGGVYMVGVFNSVFDGLHGESLPMVTIGDSKQRHVWRIAHNLPSMYTRDKESIVQCLFLEPKQDVEVVRRSTSPNKSAQSPRAVFESHGVVNVYDAYVGQAKAKQE